MVTRWPCLMAQWPMIWPMRTTPWPPKPEMRISVRELATRAYWQVGRVGGDSGRAHLLHGGPEMAPHPPQREIRRTAPQVGLGTVIPAALIFFMGVPKWP